MTAGEPTAAPTGVDGGDGATDREVSRRRGRPRRRWARRSVLAVLAVLVVVVAYVGVTFVQVWQASTHDETEASDAIVVLGAAQYDGRPSPVLAARLDHAAELYRQGLAPLVVVTGGRRAGDRFTEAEASATYLAARGVPGDAIERETSSTNSWESLAATARFLRARGITEVILVSDPYHSYRIDAIARELGLDAHVSPTTSSPITGVSEVRQLLRETVAVSLGRIIGYDRLVRIDDGVRQARD